MGKPSPAHLRMRELLTEQFGGCEIVEEEKVAGHRIDFVVTSATGARLGVDVNGDRWHRWEKVRLCDVKKLARVFGPANEEHVLVLGVWWSRLQSSPVSVVDAILTGLVEHRLAWWDWAVTFEEMDALIPGSGRHARSRVRPVSAYDWPLTWPGSGSNAAHRSR